MSDLFYCLGECAYAAKYYNNSDLKRVRLFIDELCKKCGISGYVIAFRGATRSQRRFSRFHRTFKFKRNLNRLNTSQHLTLLVKQDTHINQLMLSIPKEELCLEVIDIEKVAAIRFLIWMGSQIQKRLALPEGEFLSCWYETVIPCCFQGTQPLNKHVLKSSAWKIDKKRTLEA